MFVLFLLRVSCVISVFCEFEVVQLIFGYFYKVRLSVILCWVVNDLGVVVLIYFQFNKEYSVVDFFWGVCNLGTIFVDEEFWIQGIGGF